MQNLERLYNDGNATLEENEARIYHLWSFVEKGFKPWEVEPDYADDERIIKPEDKADLLKLDQFNINAARNRQKKKEGLEQFGLEAGQHQQEIPQRSSIFDSRLNKKKDLVFD